MRLGSILLLLATITGASALEVTGEPAYLTRKLRPEWRLVSLQAVLDDIAKAAEKPLERSQRVIDQQKDAMVVLIARQRWMLRETLVALERSQGLVFSAGPLRLAVESEADARDRRRRPVQINLAEFAVDLHPADLPATPLGFNLPLDIRGGGLDIFSQGVEVKSDLGADPAEILKRLGGTSEGPAMEVRANIAHLLVTPDEEKLARALLLEHYQLAVRRGSWRATFGLLAAGEPLATGVLTREAAAALAARLQQRSDLTLALFNHQLGHAEAAREQALVEDAEVVNAMLDPAIEVLRSGRQFQIRASRGSNFDALAFMMQWVEPMSVRERAIRRPAEGEPATLAVTAGASKDDAKQPTPTAEATAASHGGGQRATLQLPEVWSWAPRGDVMLPHGQALVLCAPHGEQTAVIICAEIP